MLEEMQKVEVLSAKRRRRCRRLSADDAIGDIGVVRMSCMRLASQLGLVSM